jgi:hypothetical protein
VLALLVELLVELGARRKCFESLSELLSTFSGLAVVLGGGHRQGSRSTYVRGLQRKGQPSPELASHISTSVSYGLGVARQSRGRPHRCQSRQAAVAGMLAATWAGGMRAVGATYKLQRKRSFN